MSSNSIVRIIAGIMLTALMIYGADAGTTKATFGFGRSTTSLVLPRSEVLRSRGDSATKGFGSSRATAGDTDRPAGALDTAVSRSISADAYRSRKDRLAPPKPTPTYAAAPTYAPTTPAAPWVSVDDRPQRRYSSDAPSNDGFNSGVVAGVLLDHALGGGNRRDGNYGGSGASYTRNSTVSGVSGGETIDVARSSSDVGTFLVILLLAAGGAALVYFVTMRPSRTATAAPSSNPNATRKGPEAMDEPTHYRLNGFLKFSPTSFVLAEAAGSLMPDLSGAHSVERIGSITLAGEKIERAYFDDGKSFMERASNPKDPCNAQTRVYHKIDERTPGSDEDWCFFLGGGAEGKPGYIGLPEIDYGDNNVHYFRTWGDSDSAISPVEFNEKVDYRNGQTDKSVHAAMQYHRSLGMSSAIHEYLYVDVPELALEAA